MAKSLNYALNFTQSKEKIDWKLFFFNWKTSAFFSGYQQYFLWTHATNIMTDQTQQFFRMKNSTVLVRSYKARWADWQPSRKKATTRIFCTFSYSVLLCFSSRGLSCDSDEEKSHSSGRRCSPLQWKQNEQCDWSFIEWLIVWFST